MDEKRETEEQETPQADGPSEANEKALDVESLDLTIETVEDRINPSETNVFDK